MALPNRSRPEDWPALPAFADWQETCAAFHLMSQVVGKVRLVQTPWVNHSWHVPLYLTARGFGTSPIAHGGRSFEMELDLLGRALREGHDRDLRVDAERAQERGRAREAVDHGGERRCQRHQRGEQTLGDVSGHRRLRLAGTRQCRRVPVSLSLRPW